MAYQNSTVSFEKMLLKFITDEDPMQSMLKWLCERLMETEVENKLCAEKSELLWSSIFVTVQPTFLRMTSSFIRSSIIII